MVNDCGVHKKLQFYTHKYKIETIKIAYIFLKLIINGTDGVNTDIIMSK